MCFHIPFFPAPFTQPLHPHIFLVSHVQCLYSWIKCSEIHFLTRWIIKKKHYTLVSHYFFFDKNHSSTLILHNRFGTIYLFMVDSSQTKVNRIYYEVGIIKRSYLLFYFRNIMIFLITGAISLLTSPFMTDATGHSESHLGLTR